MGTWFREEIVQSIEINMRIGKAKTIFKHEKYPHKERPEFELTNETDLVSRPSSATIWHPGAPGVNDVKFKKSRLCCTMDNHSQDKRDK